jgi:hypothetical protein
MSAPTSDIPMTGRWQITDQAIPESDKLFIQSPLLETASAMSMSSQLL